jgi:hypothetical protein
MILYTLRVFVISFSIHGLVNLFYSIESDFESKLQAGSLRAARLIEVFAAGNGTQQNRKLFVIIL